MYYCRKCGFGLTGTMTKCPFCQGELAGEPEGEDRFPEIPAKGLKKGLPIRLLALGTVIAAAVCIAVNYSWRKSGWWCTFVVAGLISFWIVIGIAVRKHGNPLKAVLWQVCAVSVLVFLWDYRTGYRGWSADFVIPILLACSLFAMSVIVLLMHLKPQDYLPYAVWNLLLGFIPFILLLCGAVKVIYPSVACVLIFVAGTAALILFRGAALRAELIRIFHL